MLRNTLLVPFIFTLIACGGGGGGSSDSAAPEPTQAAAPTTTSAVATPSTETTTPAQPEEPSPPDVTRTSDLTASETFEFTSSYDVTVDVNLGPGANRYLNICNDFQRTDATAEVDYGSCVLQAPLEDGIYQGTLSLTNDIRDLVIAIWSYTGEEPTYYFWNAEADGLTVVVN